MVTFLKRYHDWLVSGTPAPPPDAPPKYPTYEAAVDAANAWYQEMTALIGNGANVRDWNRVTQQAADKAALWADHDLGADRLANEARVLSRTGDLVISNALGSLGEAKFYTAVAGYALAKAASAAAQRNDSERETASAAAWAAAGARLTALGQATIDIGDRVSCDDCVIGGYESFRSAYRGNFRWLQGATDEAAAARNAYFDQYS